MVRVHAEHPEARLVLLGMGKREQATRDEVRRLGLENHVHFLGHREDVHPLLAGLDVYVQPSIQEGFGLAVIEAMAMKRPVVVSAVGGMLQTVEPNRSGLQVPPAEPTALANAILSLVNDPARARLLGERASERVKESYSLSRMLREYDAVYRRTLGNGA
jgi:glycosyltransferase involved in cell wall biosynthesis